MQGDLLSVILFTVYLAICLIKPIQTKMKSFQLTSKHTDVMYAVT